MQSQNWTLPFPAMHNLYLQITQCPTSLWSAIDQPIRGPLATPPLALSTAGSFGEDWRAEIWGPRWSADVSSSFKVVLSALALASFYSSTFEHSQHGAFTSVYLQVGLRLRDPRRGIRSEYSRPWEVQIGLLTQFLQVYQTYDCHCIAYAPQKLTPIRTGHPMLPRR
jgi:hypothetical protein